MMPTRPLLIEPITKYYIDQKLKSCHNVRTNIYSSIINGTVIVLVLGVIFFVLYTIYINKPSDEEQREQNLIAQHIIMNKLKEFRTVPSRTNTINDDVFSKHKLFSE